MAITVPQTSIYVPFDAKKTPITLLKGPSGSRKTTKAVKFPRPVLFNFDNNLSGLRNLPSEITDPKRLRIVNPTVNMKSGDLKPTDIWKNFVDQLTFVMEDDSVGTIIIDSLTTLAERLLDQIVGSADPAARVEIQHWGEFQKYLKWLGDELLCNPALDKNVIVISHEQVETDKKTGNTYLTLSVGSRIRTSYGLFTDVWRCYSKKPTAGEVEYRVRVAPTEQFDAKCSLKNLGEDFKWDEKEKEILAQIFQ